VRPLTPTTVEQLRRLMPTARTTRSVRLLAPLSKDLKTLRMQRGRPGDEELIFPRPDGEP